MKINTKYNITQRVFIKDLKIHGKINSISINTSGLTYYVRYFDGVAPKEVYFEEEELEHEAKEENIGFSSKEKQKSKNN